MFGSLANQPFQPSDLQAEFEKKNEILRSRFTELSPEDYFNLIFPDRSEFIVVLGTIKDSRGNIVEKGTVVRVPAEDIWSIAWRSNAYIPYADFKKNYYHSKTLDAVRAFVVDLDGVSSRNLKQLIRYAFVRVPEPSYIVNSGKGIHLVYALEASVKVRGQRRTLNALNEAIQNSYEWLANLDKHPIVHPYRFPGFATKIGTRASVFRVRRDYSLEELLKLFEIKPKKSQGEKKPEKGQKKGQLLYLPNGSRKFWEWFIWQLFKRPPYPGKRHNSFFALGIVSYKCKRYVPEEEAVEVVDMVYDGMERYNLHIGFTREEAHSAFRKGYNPKAVRVRWKFICDLLDWEYKPNKRNGRSREEHIAYVSAIRSAKTYYRREQLLPKVLELHSKGISLRKIAEILGVSASTLVRWLRE
ncbi:MAG: helix-turn-helix domain-containing protein [Desulfurobacteriaceae bacterium]